MVPTKVILGMMRINSLSEAELEKLIDTSLSLGINSFDNADIYAYGKCEEKFGAFLSQHQNLREKIYIQSKCGICKGYYDLSKEHILSSVDDSLKRLHTDYLDMLFLHRPDVLMEEDEVVEALAELQNAGKIRAIGVSNMSAGQTELIMSALQRKSISDSNAEASAAETHCFPDTQKYHISASQLQLSLGHTGMINEWVNVNMNHDNAKNTGGLLEFLRLHKIGIQAWSPLQHGFFKGTFLENDKYERLNQRLDVFSETYSASKSAIALAFDLRVPGVTNVVVGTTKPEHLKDLACASQITLSREDWYSLYLAAGNGLP